ncbi:MAG: hypothetical protein OHK0015_45660 [Chloroflexi bacterium OHK40]
MGMSYYEELYVREARAERRALFFEALGERKAYWRRRGMIAHLLWALGLR